MVLFPESKIRGKIGKNSQVDKNGFKKFTGKEGKLRREFLKVVKKSKEILTILLWLEELERKDLKLLSILRLSRYIKFPLQGSFTIDKIGRNFDLSPCPRRLKKYFKNHYKLLACLEEIDQLFPCHYCYGENGSFIYPLIIIPYVLSNSILNLPEKSIEILNILFGGIRVNRNGDYLETYLNPKGNLPERFTWNYSFELFLEHSFFRGLKVKVITKSIPFILKYGKDKRIDVINLSIDKFQTIDHDLAIDISKEFEKVQIRSLILTKEDLKNPFLMRKDFLKTLGHGNNCYEGKGKKHGGIPFYSFNKKEKLDLEKKHGGFCCSTGKELVNKNHFYTETRTISCQNCKYHCKV